MRGLERAYPVCDGARHRRDHGDAAAVAPADHLARDGLRSHEDAGDVDFEHGIGILGAVVERGRLLLDTRRRDYAIEVAVGLGNVADDLVQLGYVANVDLAVVEGVS